MVTLLAAHTSNAPSPVQRSRRLTTTRWPISPLRISSGPRSGAARLLRVRSWRRVLRLAERLGLRFRLGRQAFLIAVARVGVGLHGARGIGAAGLGHEFGNFCEEFGGRHF